MGINLSSTFTRLLWRLDYLIRGESHMARGLSDRDIALFISVRTVQTHLAHIYTKLGVHSRTEAEAAVPCAPVGFLKINQISNLTDTAIRHSSLMSGIIRGLYCERG